MKYTVLNMINLTIYINCGISPFLYGIRNVLILIYNIIKNVY
jgi:hypothetical protein